MLKILCFISKFHEAIPWQAPCLISMVSMPMSPLISTPLVARNTTYRIEKIDKYFGYKYFGEININASLFFFDISLFIRINSKGKISF